MEFKRRHLVVLACCAMIAALAGACDDGTRTLRVDGGADGGDSSVTVPDADGDGISDTDEGRIDNRDTDGDGTPDYLDDDSDGDGIFDSIEAGDSSPATPPEDADEDGMPNYVDTDSDGNGIPDATEGLSDTDGDTIEDFRDTDDDNDRVLDVTEIGNPADPSDYDGDGVPDFRQPDSDNDNILDGDERPRTGDAVDTDGDSVPDWQDVDSDGDGFTDAEEAGDDDPRTLPVDTDMDAIPDFRDFDSDNDGVSDADEFTLGTSPTLEDSDGDDISDLIEIGAGTDPTDPADNPRARGDFVFLVPYEMDPTPERDTLEFRTSIQFADVYFTIDASGSMNDELTALRAAVNSVVSDLTCTDFGTACTRDDMCDAGQVCGLLGTCISDPSTSNCVASPWTGVGKYETYVENVLGLQPDPMATATALNFPVPGGTEELFQAAWCIAEPSTCPTTQLRMCEPPMAGRVGCPGFRDEAVRILVMFTDEDSDGTETAAQAAAALNRAGITFIGVWTSTSTTSAARQDLVDLANLSGSVDRAGNPLVFNGVGAAAVTAVTGAINEVVEGVPLRVTIGSADLPDDAGDALQFIDHLETNTSGGPCTALPTEDTDADTFPDAFPAVTPGTPVCFDVVAARNTTVMPEASPLVFEAELTVYGDGSPLDSRRVFFLVPPEIVGPGGPD